MSPQLTVVGSINLDLVARVERLPRAGETVSGASFERVPGGKGANQAVAAARLGATVQMVGCVGDDLFAGDALSGLREAGVMLDVANVHGEPTGVALISVDAEGDNTIVVVPGANRFVRVEEVVGPVLCQLEIPPETVSAAADRASFFALNAAPANPVDARVVESADLVIVNRFELDALPASPKKLVALTLGEEGAILLEGGKELVRAAPPPITAVDGTAAGDAFCACLVVCLLAELDREEALRRACAAGAIAASRFGAQPSLPTAAEVDEILRAS